MFKQTKYPLQTKLHYIATAVIIVMICGCQKSSPIPVTAKPERYIVSPSKLFVGESGRLEPHLGLTTSGCVRLDTPDQEQWCGFSIEVWREGKVVHCGDNFHTRIRHPNEATFSLREAGEANRPKNHRVTISLTSSTGSGGAVHRFDGYDMPQYRAGTHFQLLELTDPQEFAMNESKPVWAYVMVDSKKNASGNLEEQIKSALWALVFKLSWEELPK